MTQEKIDRILELCNELYFADSEWMSVEDELNEIKEILYSELKP